MYISNILISLSENDIFDTFQCFFNKNEKFAKTLILENLTITKNAVNIQGTINIIKFPIRLSCILYNFETQNNVISISLNILRPSILYESKYLYTKLCKVINKKMSKYSFVKFQDKRIILNLNMILSKLKFLKININDILIDNDNLKIELTHSKLDFNFT